MILLQESFSKIINSKIINDLSYDLSYDCSTIALTASSVTFVWRESVRGRLVLVPLPCKNDMD